jgi:hypothetical protein
MRTVLFALQLFAILFLCTSCTYTAFTAFTQLQSSASKQILLTSGEPQRSYQELGILEVRALTTSEVHQIFRSKAREFGADAVIHIQYGYIGQIGFGIGTAVRFTDSTTTPQSHK